MRKINLTPMRVGEFRDQVKVQNSFYKMGLDDFVSIKMGAGCVLLTVLDGERDARYLYNRKVEDICDFFEYGEGKDLSDETPIFAIAKDSGEPYKILNLDVEEDEVDGERKFVMTTVVL